MCNDSIASSRRFGWSSRGRRRKRERGDRIGERTGAGVLVPFSVSADLTEKLISQLVDVVVVPSQAWLDQHVRARFMCHISHTHRQTPYTLPPTHTIHICIILCPPLTRLGKYSKFKPNFGVQIFITYRINFNMCSEIKGLGLD